MIIPDVNLLVYAARNETPEHRAARAFLEERIGQQREIAVLDVVLSSMVRILSNPRVFVNPIPLADVVARATVLRHHPNVTLLSPSSGQWAIFEDLCVRTNAAGDLVPDAYIASFAIHHEFEVASADRDFLRFPGLRLVNPLRP